MARNKGKTLILARSSAVVLWSAPVPLQYMNKLTCEREASVSLSQRDRKAGVNSRVQTLCFKELSKPTARDWGL